MRYFCASFAHVPHSLDLSMGTEDLEYTALSKPGCLTSLVIEVEDTIKPLLKSLFADYPIKFENDKNYRVCFNAPNHLIEN